MNAEIIAIGSELVNGAQLDTNSQWLSRALADLGITTRFHSSVGDELAPCHDVLRQAIARSDLLILSGGLGPTRDDLTREVLALLTGGELWLHEPSLKSIEEMFSSRGREMPERNRIQAMFPQGAIPLENPVGTAPGIWLTVTNPVDRPCHIAALPGVPGELKRMFQQQVVPRLPASTKVIRQATVRCYGAGESHMEQLLGDITARGRDPEVGITASKATISLRITATAESEAECLTKIESTRNEIHSRLGELVFGQEHDELEDAVMRILAQSNATIACVELGQTGALNDRLSRASASADCFLGGMAFSSLKAFDRYAHDLRFHAESQQSPLTSKQHGHHLAQWCREQFRCDFALATLIPLDAHETPHTGQSQSQQASIAAVATPTETLAERVALLGTRELQIARTAKTALNMLRLNLLNQPATKSA